MICDIYESYTGFSFRAKGFVDTSKVCYIEQYVDDNKDSYLRLVFSEKNIIYIKMGLSEYMLKNS